MTPEDTDRIVDTPPPAPLVQPFQVRRSTLRTWLASLLAIPFIVLGVDVLWKRRIIAWLTERIFPSDPQILEPRDEIWAWVMVIVGGVVVAWGLKELFTPAPVLFTDDDGVHLRMRGPFRRPTLLPWGSLHDLDAGTIEDDGEPLDVLIIEVNDASLLAANPWAGRRVDDRTVAMFTTEWEMEADAVAIKVADQAVLVARSDRQP